MNRRLRTPLFNFQFSIRLIVLPVSLLSCLCLAQPKSGLHSPPLDAVQAESEARALVADLLGQQPAQNSTNTGVVKIRDGENNRQEIPVKFEVFATATNWISVYESVTSSNKAGQKLVVTHSGSRPHQYQFIPKGQLEGALEKPVTLTGEQAMIPFAGSDFWLADLGLEFLHWPRQRLLKKELRRGQSCDVLESINPQPVAGGYARVVAWIDIEAPHGIIHADAYDSHNELLKQFDPKKLEKVHGQYQLEAMEIRNHKTGSRTVIELNVTPDK